ncbi:MULTISPECIES: GntR family transcriptional regulator [Cryobacterium]|uniref:GntR family transcriptional regulator n=1 Tax=Cryobacterium TaxID=69578 RepID=UPI00157F8D1F|nr:MULTISPECIES: GntR family transcriptional regulator [Cryobacterium]
MVTLLKMPRRQILSDDVFEQLKALIMNSSIPPGARMNIEDLARQLQVSPTPVREALARLESEGLTVKLPLKGYRTTDLLNADEVRNQYELRLLLEVPSAKKAAHSMSIAHAESLREEMQSIGEPPTGSRYESYQTLTAHDTRFHQLILSFAGNDMVRQAVERTHCHLHIFRLTYGGPFGENTVAEHATIADALLKGDGAAAERAMHSHLVQSRDRVLAKLP